MGHEWLRLRRALPFEHGNLRRFKAGTLKYLVNVNVLTTASMPNIDCVALLC